MLLRYPRIPPTLMFLLGVVRREYHHCPGGLLTYSMDKPNGAAWEDSETYDISLLYLSSAIFFPGMGGLPLSERLTL